MIKQEPSCPSINLLLSSPDTPENTLILSRKRGYQKMGVFCLAAVFLNVLFFLLLAFCLDIKKKNAPLFSTVQVEYQETMQSFPDLTPLSESQGDEQPAIPKPDIQDSFMLSETRFFQEIRPVYKKTSEMRNRKNNMPALSRPEHDHDQETQSVKPVPGQVERKPGLKTEIPVIESREFPSQRCTRPDTVYPLAARKRHEQGTVKVTLRILPGGRVQQVRLVESSGFTDLDQAALEAVQSIKCKDYAASAGAIQTTVPVFFTLNRN